ncbi:MAG: nucleotidyltransferase domain-containing protein [Bacteroidetes bacterium]|nr:nucleotidyltransferase domain-containing protein [Bacteroidota bacterium]
MDQAAAIEISKKYLQILIQRNFPIIRVILFGSHARGNQHPDSDIDLAIIMNELPDPFQTQVELLKLTWNFNTQIEPHPFEENDFNSTQPMINEIRQIGIEIFSSKTSEKSVIP